MTRSRILVLGGLTIALVGGGIGTPNLALPITGFQVYFAGGARDGQIPLVQKAGDASLPAIRVGTLACACVRAVAVKSCGGN